MQVVQVAEQHLQQLAVLVQVVLAVLEVQHHLVPSSPPSPTTKSKLQPQQLAQVLVQVPDQEAVPPLLPLAVQALVQPRPPQEQDQGQPQQPPVQALVQPPQPLVQAQAQPQRPQVLEQVHHPPQQAVQAAPHPQPSPS